MYTVTIRNQTRTKKSWKVFFFAHQAKTWLSLAGFISKDLSNPFTGEVAEIRVRKFG